MTATVERQLFDKAEEAWNVSWTRYFRPETNLFYDHVSSKDPAHSQDHLPTVDEVRRQLPNTCGWGTGMEDSAISAGVCMATICDRFDATGDGAMKACADKVWTGMARLDEVSKSKSGNRSCNVSSVNDRYGLLLVNKSQHDTPPFSFPSTEHDFQL